VGDPVVGVAEGDDVIGAVGATVTGAEETIESEVGAKEIGAAEMGDDVAGNVPIGASVTTLDSLLGS